MRYRDAKTSCYLAKSLLTNLPRAQILGDWEQVNLRSYIVLTHAAFEEYLEGMSKRLLNTTISLLSRDMVCIGALALISSYRAKQENMREVYPGTGRMIDAIRTRVNCAQVAHETVIKNNNGIKPSSVAALMKPFGIELERFAVLLNELQMFGERRGGLAHTGSIAVVETVADTVIRVDFILRELRLFERHAFNCCGRLVH